MVFKTWGRGGGWVQAPGMLRGDLSKVLKRLTHVPHGWGVPRTEALLPLKTGDQSWVSRFVITQ